VILLLALLVPQDPLVLRDHVRVETRYVRLGDLLQTEAPESCRAVFLGRAPGAGASRLITADEIRRELSWRGLSATVSGERVEVLGPGAIPGRPSRRASGVRRGDVVRAVSPAFEADARALEDGAPGREIAVEFLATKKRARARVSGEDRVEVIP
jgi:hypothetical protein